MSKWIFWVVGGLVIVALALPAAMTFFSIVRNPQVERELREDPQGERARKVMLLTLPSGRTIPVNYLREGERVYAGADGRWWQELDGAPRAVEILVRGETFAGRARAVRDDPDYTRDVFARLRPNAVPGFGTLVEILLDPTDPGGPPDVDRARGS